MNVVELIFGLSHWMPDSWKNQYGYKSKFGPGKIIEKLSAEQREKLSQLKSEDLRNLRPDAIYIYDEFQRQRDVHREMLVAFDNKLKEAEKAKFLENR